MLAARATEVLARLVAFDTTSRNSNLGLIEYVEAELGALGVSGRRVPNADGRKANLFATLGPSVEGGVVLSGHTDVVPVDGQPWTSDPFTLTRRDGRLYGRGTCDMKGFLALAIAAAPTFAAGGLKRPAHLAFSYDEEVGCLGAPDMIEAIAAMLADTPRCGRLEWASLPVTVTLKAAIPLWPQTASILVGSPTTTADGRGSSAAMARIRSGAPRQPTSSS